MDAKQTTITVACGVVVGLAIGRLCSRRPTLSKKDLDVLQYGTSKSLSEITSSGRPFRSPLPYPLSSAPFVITESPVPEWKPGDAQPSPYIPADESGADPVLHMDPKDVGNCYDLMISAVTPRPIAFVSTKGKDGSGNLAPFSYFNVVCHKPPTVMISINTQGKDGLPKDTMANILETKEFVVNIISDWMVESSNLTCGNFPRGVDEMKMAGLTPVECAKVDAARVKESAFAMECTVRSVTPIYTDEADGVSHDREGGNDGRRISTYVVLGHVVMFHVQKGAMSDDGKVMDLERFRPISRLGACLYAPVQSAFPIPRPSSADVEEVIRKRG